MSFKRKWIFLLAALLLPTMAFAQNSETIWTPELSYSWKSSNRLGFNSKLALFNSVSNFDNEGAIEYIEPQISLTYGVSPRTKIGVGYLYRYVTPLVDGYQYEHRFIQQISYASYFGDRRFAHRLRTEQRIRTNSYQNRVRYRLSYDFPLKGNGIDEREKYFLINNEAIAAFNKDNASGENRFKVALGWYFNQKQKFELGLQYRTQNLFNTGDVGHLFVLSTSYYLNR